MRALLQILEQPFVVLPRALVEDQRRPVGQVLDGFEIAGRVDPHWPIIQVGSIVTRFSREDSPHWARIDGTFQAIVWHLLVKAALTMWESIH